MANEKISAMPAASSMDVADVFPIVQGGVNKKATRDVLFTAPAGSAFFLNVPNGYIYLDDSPFIEMSVGAGGVINILWNGFQAFNVDAAGQINMVAYTGQSVTVSADGGYITIDGSGGVTIVDNSGGSVAITYHAQVVTDWNGTDPLYVAKALDRIAAWIKTNIGPIP